VVQARLNGRVTARLTLDTGADVSVIKPELLRAAGVDLSRPATSGSASGITGQAQADFYQVTLAVEGRSLALPYVAAINTGEPDSDDLLGRDFLSNWKVTMSGGVLKLSPLAAPPSPNAVG
jgi:hypothetical protein